MILALKTIELFAAAEPLLVSVPESIGVLVLGIVLVIAAVVVRNFLDKTRPADNDEEIVKKA